MQTDGFSDQNVFEMFVTNGGPGFWVRRTTWRSSCARIIRVGPMTKPGPYFGNPSVLMDVFSLKGDLQEGLAKMPVPGTYKTWRLIAPPSWASSVNLRPLDDPGINAAFEALDRRRGRKTSDAESVGSEEGRVYLSVPFSHKEEAKRIGARWSPTEKAWWLPAGDATAITAARNLGFLSHGV